MIAVVDPRDDDVHALLERHLAFCREHSPPEDVHALTTESRSDESVTFYGMREHGTLVAVGALKRLEAGHAEIKSMHTVVAARRRGVAETILAHLLQTAREQGLLRVSLETGTMDAFAPARALYRKAGFVDCVPFADYVDSPNSCFMTISLEAGPTSMTAAPPDGRRPG